VVDRRRGVFSVPVGGQRQITIGADHIDFGYSFGCSKKQVSVILLFCQVYHVMTAKTAYVC